MSDRRDGAPADEMSPYVLVTPARDEADNIGRTISSVLAQTVPPARWVIVDDGSVDRTAAIVRDRIARQPNVELVCRPPGGSADFASKVQAFRVGVAALARTPYQFVGNLDADIALPPAYYEQLLQRFAGRSRLGVAGGSVVVDLDGHVRVRRTSRTSVAGAVQFFRRQCFEEIGGLLPLRLGGEDAAAEISARMHGWEVETFTDLTVTHHGRVDNRKRNAAVQWFSRGRVNHSLGYDPAFHVLMSAHRALDRPYVLGGALMLAGYVSAAATKQGRALAPETVVWLRREQRRRLRRMLGRR